MSDNRDAEPRPTTAAQEAELALWRAKALERMPYFAPILFSLRVLDAPGLGTFAVDARHRLYVDFGAVASWSALENAEALLHECGHLFRDHAARAEARGVRDGEYTVWNIAADAMLNLDLVQAGCRTLGQKGILPAKLGLPDGRTTEWYFDQLRPKLGPDTASQGAGKPYAGCGSGAGAAPAPGEIDGVGDGAAQGASDVERELVRINTAAAIRQHAEQRGRGSVPGGLLQEAEQVLSPPKVPWQQVLAPAIRRAVASRAGHYDVDPSRRHRRRHRVDIAPGRRAVYPGTYSPTPTLVLIRDTSASVSDTELERYTSEVVGIATGMGIRGRDLRVMDVDAAVQHTADYAGAAGLARVHGRGGTDMRVGIAAALDLKPRPHAIVVFTDGETHWPDTKPVVPLVVCLVGDTAEAAASRVPEWAVALAVDDD
jgi:predicted metal-dependent peptidase